MSYTKGSYIIKCANRIKAVAEGSAVVSAFKKQRGYARHSMICTAIKKLPGRPEQLEKGRLRSCISSAGKRLNDAFDGFRGKRRNVLSSSVFVSWLDCSKFLLFPILYFVIDYALRIFVAIDVLSSYWDEAILLMGFCFAAFKRVLQTKNPYENTTPLGIPILLFVLFYTALMLANSPDTEIGIEGLRAVTQYMLWYFVAIFLIASKEDFDRVYRWFLIMGTVFALHGAYQFVTNAPMPEHWVDMAEKGVRTRAFSIIGSPNILGSVMTLLIPMAFAGFFEEKAFLKKMMYGGSAGVMALCLLFTQSRGAWIGFAIALLVFFLMYDTRYLFPVFVAGLLVFALVPQVYDRITYMLSKEYMLSSLTGGRLIRWQSGMDMLLDNFVSGTGIGRFGGAVAMNHKDLFPDTFYMDNYYLKTAVEGGIFAITAFAALMVSVVRWGFGALAARQSHWGRTRIMGMLAGLVGVIVHNAFENVFEVPAMVTYFWIVVAMIMYVGYGDREKEETVGQSIREGLSNQAL